MNGQSIWENKKFTIIVDNVIILLYIKYNKIK